MNSCANCGAEIEEAQTFCDAQCEFQYLGIDEEDDPEEDDDGYG